MVKRGQRRGASHQEDEYGHEEDQTPDDKEFTGASTDASYLVPESNHLGFSCYRLNNFIGRGIAAPHVFH